MLWGGDSFQYIGETPTGQVRALHGGGQGQNFQAGMRRDLNSHLGAVSGVGQSGVCEAD